MQFSQLHFMNLIYEYEMEYTKKSLNNFVIQTDPFIHVFRLVETGFPRVLQALSLSNESTVVSDRTRDYIVPWV